MSIQELIEELEKARDIHGKDTPVYVIGSEWDSEVDFVGFMTKDQNGRPYDSTENEVWPDRVTIECK